MGKRRNAPPVVDPQVYVPTNWVDGSTPVNAANLNKLETAVATLASAPAGGAVDYENVYAPATPYQAGDVVTYQGITYLAVNPSTGSTPPAVPGLTAAVPVVGIGTALPGSPADGDEFILVDSLTAPTYSWRFRYVASITDGYKWVFVGGPPAVSAVLTAQDLTNTAYADVATVGPDFTVPRAGIWRVAVQAMATSAAGGSAHGFVSYAVGATVASDEWAAAGMCFGAAFFASVVEAQHTIAAATLIRAKYRCGVASQTVNFRNRRLSVTPQRVA